MSKRLHKRRLSLLEVLIAFALIVLCVFPLIAPHVLMLKAEHGFIDQVKLDHFINNHYVEILQKLQQNEIPWNAIEEERATQLPFPPYEGEYLLRIKGQKIAGPAPQNGYLLELKYRFAKGSEEPVEYSYLIYAFRQLAEEAPDEDQ